jgi:DNA-binding Lrp family transcriptional regulator
LDLADKRILLELDANCRTSYQTLAKKLGLSVSAVKKRVEKLTQQGVIRKFIVYLSLAMAGAEVLLAIVSTNRGTADDAFLERFGANPMVWAAVPLFNDDIFVFAEYVGAQGLAKLGEFLRGVEGVTEVEMHTLLYDRGSKRDLTNSDLQVLNCVRRDPRIPVAGCPTDPSAPAAGKTGAPETTG